MSVLHPHNKLWSKQTDAEQCTSGTQEAEAITSEQEGTQASHKHRQATQQGLPPSNKLSLSTCEEESPCRCQIVFELFSYINSKRRGLLQGA